MKKLLKHLFSMKFLSFSVLMILGLNAFANPEWEAPSDEYIARSAFRDMHMNVSHVDVSEFSMWSGRPVTQKSLSFSFEGVAYNCVMNFSAPVFFNPEMNGYQLPAIMISGCEDSDGESAEPVNMARIRMSAFFGSGVVFTRGNAGFIPNPYRQPRR